MTPNLADMIQAATNHARGLKALLNRASKTHAMDDADWVLLRRQYLAAREQRDSLAAVAAKRDAVAEVKALMESRGLTMADLAS